MKRMSPPAGVHARSNGHAGPLYALRDFGVHAHLDAAEELLEHFAGDHQFFIVAFDHAPRLLAADRAQHLLQLAHAGFARVVAHNVAHRVLGKLDLLRRDAVLLDLARNEVAEGNVHLLLLAVALQEDQLHPVQQRRRNGIEHVGRADEEHLRQIERHVKVVVAEDVVLLRVKRLKKRGRRIAAEVAAQLVDLVEHDDRIVGLGPANALDDLARQARRCRCGDGRESPPRRACRPARCAGTCGPARARWTGPGWFCPRPEGRQSTGSAPSCPASARAHSDSRECDPSPFSARSGPRPESPWPCRYRLWSRSFWPREARPATRCSCG